MGLRYEGNNVLVIGKGAREHALAFALERSPEVSNVFVTPGNAGTEEINNKKIKNIPNEETDDHNDIVKICEEHKIDLVVIGPELPLANGLVDRLQKEKIPVFGPTKEASRLEWDKCYAKKFMKKANIPTAESEEFHEASGSQYDSARLFINELMQQTTWQGFVVKASGLAGGKGVTVFEKTEEAIIAIDKLEIGEEKKDCFKSFVVEEMLFGYEISVTAFVDGEDFKLLPFCQDHKRRFDGNKGPNTGGMGASGPLSLTDKEAEDIETLIVKPTVTELHESGIAFTGILYFGLMMTKSGPKVLEFNCRFGDPETQVLMTLLQSDLFQVLKACIEHKLGDSNLEFNKEHFVVCTNVVIASYPGDVTEDLGEIIDGYSELAKMDAVRIYCGGAKLSKNEPGKWVTCGGRVLSICAATKCLKQSASLAREAASTITLARETASKIAFNQIPPGRKGFHNVKFTLTHRNDIGVDQLIREQNRQNGSLTYKYSGVDIDKADSLVREIKRLTLKTRKVGVKSGVGMFAAIFDPSKVVEYEKPLYVSATDGVGTKLKISIACKSFCTLGMDLVAMSVNDILVHGAKPLFFLDYIATSHIDESVISNIIFGITQGCNRSRCPLIGGETAEMPGLYKPGELDLAGFAVGVVEESKALPKIDLIKSGDALIGISSSGLHSNGFSLVRKLIERMDLNYDIRLDPCSLKLGEVLMAPTNIYYHALPILESGDVLAAAHITGGGLIHNIRRVIPDNLKIVIDRKWFIPHIYGWLTASGVSFEEMLKTFNLGVGMVLVVRQEDLHPTIQKLNDSAAVYGACHMRAFHAGHLTEILDTTEEKENFEVSDILREALRNEAVIFSSKCHPKFFSFLPKKRVSVLISGTGSNLKAIVHHTLSGPSSFKVVSVVSNKEDAPGLDVNEHFEIDRTDEDAISLHIIDHKKFTSKNEFDNEIDRVLSAQSIDVVVLAGFMRVLGDKFVRKWFGRLINIHPSLLPSFKGLNPQNQALTAGVTITGCTVHYVDEGIDTGTIIAQEAVPILPSDTVESLSERIKKAEHILYPKVIEDVARGKVFMDKSGFLMRSEQ